MQNHNVSHSDTYTKPTPRDEQLRIPGSSIQKYRQRSQPRTSHQVTAVPRLPPPCSQVGSANIQTCRIPRMADIQSRVPPCCHPRAAHQVHTQRDQGPESMGILDYYLYPSPLANVAPIPGANVQADGSTIAAFDCGFKAVPVGMQAARAGPRPRRTTLSTPRSIPEQREQALEPAPTNVKSSLQGPKPRKASLSSLSKPLPSTPTESRCQYSLFPKEPLTPPASVYSDSSIVSSSNPCNPTRPRKASLASSSVRSRADSGTSIRLLPAATFSTPLHKQQQQQQQQQQQHQPMRVRTLTQSSAGSPQQMSVSSGPPSRWSGDTVTASLDSPGCVVGAAEDTDVPRFSLSPWPPTGSFFEDDDDDDEEVPLRRKVVEKLRRQRNGGRGSTISNTTASERQGELKTWTRRWLGCACGRKP